MTRLSDGLKVESETWVSARTRVYLCPVAPRRTSSGVADPGQVRIDASCHDYGDVEGRFGLKAELAFADLTDAERATFGGAADWHLLLISLDPARPVVYETVVRGGPIE